MVSSPSPAARRRACARCAEAASGVTGAGSDATTGGIDTSSARIDESTAMPLRCQVPCVTAPPLRHPRNLGGDGGRRERAAVRPEVQPDRDSCAVRRTQPIPAGQPGPGRSRSGGAAGNRRSGGCGWTVRSRPPGQPAPGRSRSGGCGWTVRSRPPGQPAPGRSRSGGCGWTVRSRPPGQPAPGRSRSGGCGWTVRSRPPGLGRFSGPDGPTHTLGPIGPDRAVPDGSRAGRCRNRRSGPARLW